MNARRGKKLRGKPLATERQSPAEIVETHGSLAVLSALSIVVGLASGLLGAAFRKALDQAYGVRDAVIAWAEPWGVGGLLLVVAACAATAGIAAWMVRRHSPQASGSGIPHVEAVLARTIPQAPFRLIAVKFFGGLLAIGGGLALGREGPSVQMGACSAHLIGHVFKRQLSDCLVLLAAGAGAGLATAFNAPIAGAVFVLEELVRRFDTRITLATFGASASAIWVSRQALGDAPEFQVNLFAEPHFGTLPIYLVFGAVAGVLGVLYNQALLGALAVTDHWRRVPVEIRAAAIGAIVGVLAWNAPSLVGGGGNLTQQTLKGGQALDAMGIIFLIRFGLGPISYAARTPGGLFAPMLVLGAQSGALFGLIVQPFMPEVVPEPTVLAVVGMAAFFTAVVRAPVTGIILVTEMIGDSSLLLPMLAACFMAMLVPTLLQNEPIYESLKVHAVRTHHESIGSVDNHAREQSSGT